jgi:peptide chain release factor 1
MIDRLDLLEKRYEEINNLLMQNDIISDVKKSRELSIELKSIEETVITYRKYKKY